MHPNIAPQHFFDAVGYNDNVYGHSPSMHHSPSLRHSPSLPVLPHMRQPSPGSYASLTERHLEPPQTYEVLQQANTTLKTRVSELEVINGLFKGRVQELERAEMTQRMALEQAHARANDMHRRMEDLEREVSELRRASGPQKRRMDFDGEAPIRIETETSPPNPKRSRTSDVESVHADLASPLPTPQLQQQMSPPPQPQEVM